MFRERHQPVTIETKSQLVTTFRAVDALAAESHFAHWLREAATMYLYERKEPEQPIVFTGDEADMARRALKRMYRGNMWKDVGNKKAIVDPGLRAEAAEILGMSVAAVLPEPALLPTAEEKAGIRSRAYEAHRDLGLMQSTGAVDISALVAA